MILDGAERRTLIARGAASWRRRTGCAVADDRPARRGHGPGRMAGAAAGRHRPGVHGGAARGAGHHHAHPPEIFRAAHGRRRAGAAASSLVANIEASDGGAAIVAGNERVLRARLSDARFFWDQDRKALAREPPAGAGRDHLPRQARHAGASASSGWWRWRVRSCRYVPGADRMLAEHAALLAKADLVTGMVGEFPELQGIMGGYYAAAQGEPAPSPRRSATTTRPRVPDDRCPTAPVTSSVALADKLDTLVGFFAVDISPTGSKDPFALRRARSASSGWCSRTGCACRCAGAFAAALAGYGDRLAPASRGAVGELLAFFADRLKVQLRERGVRHDLIAAVSRSAARTISSACSPGSRRCSAFLDTEDGANLLAAYRRAANIVAHRGEEGRPRAMTDDPVAAPAGRARRRRRCYDGAARLLAARSTRALAARGLCRGDGRACRRCARRSTRSSTR